MQSTITSSENYSPTRYANDQLPPILEPCEDALPAEKRAQKELAKKEKVAKLAHKEEEITKNKQPGFLGAIKSGALTAKNAAEKGATSLSLHAIETFDEKSDEKSIARWRKVGLPVNETLQSDFHCQIVNGIVTAVGWLFISRNYLVFRGNIKGLSTESGEKEPLSLMLPLNNISSIQRGVSSSSIEKGKPRVIQITNDPPLADSLLVYSNDGCIHQFYDFVHFSRNYYSDMFVVLDRTWRNSFVQTM